MEAYIQFTWRQQAISEQPKVIYSYKRREIIRQILLFHLVPVSINFVLLGLYVRQVLWVPPWPTTNILNTLQFAAKVHETLMIASLASVLLHHIRHRLLSSSHGIPLGILTSPFRLLDMTYLWSQEFLAACSSEKGIDRVISIVIHVYLFVLAAILGPASAISMLPRLRDWELAHTIAEAHLPSYWMDSELPNSPTHAYIGGRLSDIYPQKVTEVFISRDCDYGNLSQPQTYNCPRYGLEDILNGRQLPTELEAGNDDDDELVRYRTTLNVTVQSIAGPGHPSRTIVVRLRTQLAGSHDTVVDATTPLDVIIHLSQIMLWMYTDHWATSSGVLPAGDRPARFNLYPGQLDPENSPSSWKQPFVSSSCSVQRVTKTNESRSLSFDFNRCFDDFGCGPKYTVDVDSKFLPTSFNNTGVGFLDVSNLKISPSFSPSAAFIYTQSSNTTLCLIKANWVDFTLNGFIPWYGSGNFEWTWKGPEPDWIEDAENWFNETNPTQLIQLDLEWLDALNNGSGRGSDHRFFERLRSTCLEFLTFEDNYLDSPHNQPSINLCMASGLSLGITEGLSKVPYHFSAHILGFPNANFPDVNLSSSMTLNPWTSTGPRFTWYNGYIPSLGWKSATLSPSEIRETSTRLEFAVFEELHGYGFHGVTIILAFVALFLYVATAFVHILIMIFGTMGSSRAWEKLGEFLVLAFRSPVLSALENTGAGVKSSSTWKARLSIQELQNGKTVGMRVVEPDLSGTQNASGSRVRPEWKYS